MVHAVRGFESLPLRYCYEATGDIDVLAFSNEARHTAATWLNHAGVPPKAASQLMGRKTPEYQLGAASIATRTRFLAS
jgi:hypothetical protein